MSLSEEEKLQIIAKQFTHSIRSLYNLLNIVLQSVMTYALFQKQSSFKTKIIALFSRVRPRFQSLFCSYHYTQELNNSPSFNCPATFRQFSSPFCVRATTSSVVLSVTHQWQERKTLLREL